MALSYGFYNSINSDRTYDAIQFGQIFDGIIKDGIYATYEKAMVVIASDNAGEVIIQPGRAWFNHTWSYNDANFVIEAPSPDVLLERIDALVLDVNTELAFRENSFKWVEGTPSSRPERPALTNTVTHHQYPLCYVHRYPETTMIYTRDITNAVGTSETPFVTGVLTGLDIDMWINQWDDEFHTWENRTRTQFEGWMINQQEVYTTWFNSVRDEMEGNMTEFEAWFETIRGIIDEEAATHLQAEIDALAEMLPAGSHIEIHTTESTLYNRSVTVSDQGGHSKTVRFDASGNAVVESFPYVGLLDFTSTDGVRTASSSITTPYFGRYNVVMAFWAATVNLVSDESFAGIVVTVTDSLGEDKAYVTLDSTGSGVFTATYPDEYTFSLTYGGQTMEVSLAVTQETTYEVELHGGFRFDQWLSAGRVSEEFDTLDEILADEKTLRQLFLVHDSVDYICNTFSESATSALTDITKIFECDLAAKWINLSDYALDHFYAVSGIKSIMDTADKYGYGEWTLVGQVPKMTSNTAPYGEAFVVGGSTSSGHEAYKAFDGDDSTETILSSGTTSRGVGYHFIEQKEVRKVFVYLPSSSSYDVAFKVQYSDDGTNYEDAYTGTYTVPNKTYFDVPISGKHSYWRAMIESSSVGSGVFATLQFYAYAPKGNVPIMTSDTAPYGTIIYSNTRSSSQVRMFDGDDSTYTETNAGTWTYGYKFVNPVNVRRLSYFARENYAIGTTIDVKASNDGTNYTTIASFQTTTNTEKQIVNIDNDNYYLYYIITSTNGTGGAGRTLQFYGRELKVSVPVMTSNTAPFGVAFASRSMPNDETAYYLPYKAFDKSVAQFNYWCPVNTGNPVGDYVGYKFTRKCCIKMLAITNSEYPNNAIKDFKLQGSNDGFINDVNDIYTGINAQGANATNYFDIDAINEYSAFRIICVTYYGTVGTNNLNIKELQFYCRDYSEKEFEVGTTRKWLYDHGVELETLDWVTEGSGVTMTKEDSQIVLHDTSTSYAGVLFVDSNGITAGYSLLRLRIGDKDSFSETAMNIKDSKAITANNLGILSINSSNAPNNFGLDVSNVNTGYVGLNASSRGYTGKVSISEWWLEQQNTH